MGGVAVGAECLVRGLAFVARRPRLWLFGLLPAVVTFVVLGGLLALLIAVVGDAVTWATPFADGWPAAARDAVRVLAAVMLVGAAALLAVVLFVSLTLVIGQPFYEHLSRRVDVELGDAADEPDERWHRGLRRAIRETLAVLARTLPASVLVFLIGLVPVVGQVAGPVLGALVGGRFLTLELLGPSMDRRGRHLDERLALVRQHRAAVYGFGVPAFVAFLVPLVALLAMPAAVAGATLLARRLEAGEPPQATVVRPEATGR